MNVCINQSMNLFFLPFTRKKIEQLHPHHRDSYEEKCSHLVLSLHFLEHHDCFKYQKKKPLINLPFPWIYYNSISVHVYKILEALDLISALGKIYVIQYR